MPSPHTHCYQSYLVRLWRSGADGMWRVSAQQVQSGETLRFANLESLFTYLQAQTSTDNVGGANVDNADRDHANNATR